LHAHSRGFNSGFLFAATHQDLGLQDARFLPVYVKTIPGEDLNYGVAMKAAGFESQAQFEDYLFRNLNKASLAYDRICAGPGSNRSNPLCSRSRPGLICQGWKGDEEVDGWVFDRRPPTCCKDWSFVKDEPYVAVGIFEWDGRPTYPIGTTTFPSPYPQHLSWMMRYVRADGKVTVTGSVGEPRKDGKPEMRSGADGKGCNMVELPQVETPPRHIPQHPVLVQLPNVDFAPGPAEMHHALITLVAPLLVTAAVMLICFSCRWKKPSQQGPRVAISPSLSSKCLWYHASLVPCVVIPLALASSFGRKDHTKRDGTYRASSGP